MIRNASEFYLLVSVSVLQFKEDYLVLPDVSDKQHFTVF